MVTCGWVFFNLSCLKLSGIVVITDGQDVCMVSKHRNVGQLDRLVGACIKHRILNAKAFCSC